MLNWLLIVSITLVSTSMLIFVSTYIAILPETSEYYNQDRSYILLLSNSFNILYLIITPFIFTMLKKKYCFLVIISVILTGIGCVGRYLCKTNYTAALIMSSLVAIGHIPIITAPYGLFELFSESQRGYAASIPLFVPTLGINFSILYGMTFIASQDKQFDNFTKFKQIENLNFINALIAGISCLLTLFCVIMLKKQIRKHNQQDTKETIQQTQSCFFKDIKKQFKGSRFYLYLLICWGSILGLNWTYGGMFGVFLQNSGLSNKDIALVGLFANLSSVFFSNIGNWISNYFKLENKKIIFYLNICGFIASVFMQASSQLNKYALIFTIIILRAGFSSFVSLALIELSHCGPSVLISAIFFYIANASNLIGNYIIDMFQNSISLPILSILIWICLFIVQKSYQNLLQMNEKLNPKKHQKEIIKRCQLQEESFSQSLKQINSICSNNQNKTSQTTQDI